MPSRNADQATSGRRRVDRWPPAPCRGPPASPVCRNAVSTDGRAGVDIARRQSGVDVAVAVVPCGIAGGFAGVFAPDFGDAARAPAFASVEHLAEFPTGERHAGRSGLPVGVPCVVLDCRCHVDGGAWSMVNVGSSFLGAAEFPCLVWETRRSSVPGGRRWRSRPCGEGRPRGRGGVVDPDHDVHPVRLGSPTGEADDREVIELGVTDRVPSRSGDGPGRRRPGQGVPRCPSGRLLLVVGVVVGPVDQVQALSGVPGA